MYKIKNLSDIRIESTLNSYKYASKGGQMKDIFAIVNNKGGVAKTSTVGALGCFISKKKQKVLCIDLDPQCNLTFTLLGTTQPQISIFEVITNQAKAKEAIIKTNNGYDLLPASSSLYNADTTITNVGKEYKLKEAIQPLLKSYDYIIIDTPPALGILTVNALTACTKVIIPAQADVYSLQGISTLSNTINAVKQYCNKDLKISGILLTRYNPRVILARDIATMIENTTAKDLGTKIFKTSIRECVAIKEAQAQNQDIYTYAPKSNASTDYKNLVNELLKGK